jgi:hypothetical protein
VSGARKAALAALLLLFVAGCGDTLSYTRQQVEQAFAAHGLYLRPVTSPPTDHRGAQSGFILAPVSREPFLVILADTDKEAAKSYSELRSQATNESFDLRRGNVVATSDHGLSPTIRSRIRASLAALPPPA